MEIDAEAVRSLIRAKVAQYKNLKQAAWMIGLHEQYLGEILNGHRPPGLKVLKRATPPMRGRPWRSASPQSNVGGSSRCFPACRSSNEQRGVSSSARASFGKIVFTARRHTTYAGNSVRPEYRE